MSIEIFTFGDFDIKLDGDSVLKKGKRNNKNLVLLKYFVTFQNKKLVPEDIIESIWPDADFIDPKNALRTQIFRLRKNLEFVGLIDVESLPYRFDIIFENGFYIFNTGDDCIIDYIQFEDSIKKADNLRATNPDDATEIYRQIIDIYKGEYLAENPYSEWVFIIRSRYHRLFVQSVLRLFKLLKDKKQFNEIIDIYEKVVNYEPFEESFHVYFLESLLELKEYKNALSHYNYITGKLYKEMSIGPTPELESIYRKITSDKEERPEKNLTQISLRMTNSDAVNGALFCDLDYFKTIYNFERRKILRSGNMGFLGLISIVDTSGNFSEKNKDIAGNLLENILLTSLRKGDVFAWWNPYQIILLLTNVSENNLQDIGSRIKTKFKNEILSDKIRIEISFQPVGSKESFIQ
ncbi:BTAD domain-containing putative transcriptional regulator [Tepidanaerobacter sp. EBM-38]|uniref:BTAD domain-containing putative transcriptional regulator n=1 Tax=Tepidanaerobacter sp. EBM-38 TaxID=1918496 RepID=UPI000AB556C9|nr:BTAD domain-containing putative transcriptional regulator [Tepidanaerobacter sp. EBM-38]